VTQRSGGPSRLMSFSRVIKAAMAVLYRSDSRSSWTFLMARWVARRSDSEARAVASSSRAVRHTPSRKRRIPKCPHRENRRFLVRAEKHHVHAENIGTVLIEVLIGIDNVPRDFDILAPSLMIRPWARNFLNGSSK